MSKKHVQEQCHEGANGWSLLLGLQVDRPAPAAHCRQPEPRHWRGQRGRLGDRHHHPGRALDLDAVDAEPAAQGHYPAGKDAPHPAADGLAAEGLEDRRLDAPAADGAQWPAKRDLLQEQHLFDWRHGLPAPLDPNADHDRDLPGRSLFLSLGPLHFLWDFPV